MAAFVDGEPLGGLEPQPRARPVEREAEAAEAPAEVAREVEEAEMQARRRRDPHGRGTGRHGAHLPDRVRGPVEAARAGRGGLSLMDVSC